MFTVPAPRHRKMKEIRAWLLENVGEPGVDWDVNVDRIHLDLETEVRRPRVTELFNIGFTKEEDKVKFILLFL